MEKQKFCLVALLIGLVMASVVLAKPKQKEPIDSVILIHDRDGRIKPVGGAATCYKLLGVKWKSLPINYVINPSNGPENQQFIEASISAAAEEWDEHTSKELFDGYQVAYNANWGVLDSKNSYVFDSYPDERVIAVTKYWYYRYSKEMVEYDVLFNTYYTWLDCTQTTCDEQNKGMDLQTIALHETGHGIGLADVYNKACSDVVMYGYSDYGDVQRELTSADITGLQKLYGA